MIVALFGRNKSLIASKCQAFERRMAEIYCMPLELPMIIESILANQANMLSPTLELDKKIVTVEAGPTVSRFRGFFPKL